MEFEVGSKYKIIKNGCSISWTETNCIPEVKIITKNLHIGDIVKYKGRIDFPGCEVSYDIFELEDTEGVFWPNQFGSAKEEYLEKII
ncbi:MAG: hypothetical protein APG12_01391 [Candidatus Methanofastidiosum methylothiophilum]|uniref:Uncharacterized protein n=1 Tax=Candidatus Methanofastidiosum methylothiophilum TaxID=1705564 RepID=A0A150IXD7_9EURY|nr:MAG: hypothetical protein APG10_00080 [Candidatus Methanofastidiosum methylthiophilus]KYC47139.1 MAG: hypothetical protein APG11_01393 [Candidatus Methanofastidiosum methylthiophilus]KYC49555.1 MAG: hypothetical protein APG12_01391 [Candidatus Methanofastidiosum methylthiophilus]